MCTQELVVCPMCDYQRRWNWDKCSLFINQLTAYATPGEFNGPKPTCEECPNTKKYGLVNPNWVLNKPALKCGNENCPSKQPYLDMKIDHERRQAREETRKEKREEEERKQKEIEEAEEKRLEEAREEFARLYFQKRPVPKIREDK